MPTRILIVEDDQHKMDRLREACKVARPSAEIVEATSFNRGLKAVRSERYDLVLLDMSLRTFDPAFDGDEEEPQPFGGREVISYMKQIGNTSPILVVTQYEQLGSGSESMSVDELADELSKDHPDLFMGLVFFDGTSNKWQHELIAALSQVTGGGA
ncbi:response regulator [uncultured Meiothermus sp.]|jgi:CheY-like chemotaxis protein|uniref:response regulator n=1 Tax=uncultured Meiothermus sp. TaxID=157471 RepID=UPI00261C3287|nr:response regulator [uncultured Meiothermus sp.]